MKCPSCGRENPAGEQYCLDCGVELSAKAESVVAGDGTVATDQRVVTLDLAGPAANQVFTMTAAEVLIGRRDAEAGIFPEVDFDGNDIVIDNGEQVHAVSRRHGRLFRDGELLKYEDLGSTNGSTLNGTPVPAHEPQPLKDGDKIVLGRTCRIGVHVASA